MGFATFSAASSCVRPSFLICSGGSVNFLVCASMPDMIIVIFVITSSYWARLERSSLFAHGGCPPFKQRRSRSLACFHMPQPRHHWRPGRAGEASARPRRGRFGRGELVELRNYSSPAWADTIADRTADVTAAIRDFLVRVEREHGLPTTVTARGEGEIAGIRYRIHGRGPAVVLMPLSLAPSQWEPLLLRLSNDYAVIVLGGAHLGIISLLEERARSGYGELIAQVLDRTEVALGDAVLEVGCGSGAVARALANRLGGANPIIATDINPYILSEARALARVKGLSEAIKFEHANAEALPYPDAQFDLAVCTTVLEEGDADRMLSELTRVTRPVGRIAVLTRAIDLGWWANLPVPGELKSKINALGPSTGAGVCDHGCADASLYARLTKGGLTPSMLGPQFAIYRDGERLA